MCKYKEQAMERAGEMPVLPQTDGAMMTDAALTLDALRTIIKAKDGEIATLTAENTLLAEKVGAAVDNNAVLTDAQIIEACEKEGLGPCLGLAVGRAIEKLCTPPTRPQSLAPSAVPEVKLWDSQWLAIFTHERCYEGMSKEDAVRTAVKLTEKRIKLNFAEDLAKRVPAVAQPERSDAPAVVAVTEGWQLVPKDATWEMTRPALSFSLYRVKCDCGQEHQGGLSHNKAAWLYREMLLAAPSQQPTDSAAPAKLVGCRYCGKHMRDGTECWNVSTSKQCVNRPTDSAAPSGDEVVK